jgi:hypothetical protein
MAEDKKGFLLYADLIHTIEKMPNDKAGLLFKHILNYVNDLNPVTDDLIVELTFEPIKQQLKRDLLKYKETKIDKSNGGKLGNLKRWHKDLHDKVIKNELDINEAIEIANNRKTSHTDTMQSLPIGQIAVNDNVNVKVINNNIESIDYDVFLEFINTTFGRKFQLINNKVKNKYKALLKQGYKKNQIKQAVINASKNDYHKQTNYQYCTPEYFSRAETIDKFSSISLINNDNVYIPNQELN